MRGHKARIASACNFLSKLLICEHCAGNGSVLPSMISGTFSCLTSGLHSRLYCPVKLTDVFPPLHEKTCGRSSSWRVQKDWNATNSPLLISRKRLLEYVRL